MPITTVPAKTSISRRTIQLKPITGSRRMATISLHHSRTIPTRHASQQPVQGYAPGTQGNNIPGGTYGNGQPYGQSAAYGSSVPAYGSAAPAYGQPTQPAQPAQPIYGQPTYGPTDYAQSAQTPYYQEPTQPQYTQSAYNQPPTYAQQTYYQATQQQPGYGYAQKSKIVAGLLGLFLGTLGVHNLPPIWDTQARPWPSCC